MTVAAILKHKSNDIASVTPYTSISDVTTLLAQRRIGAVLVLDAAGGLAGIVSERDIMHCLAIHGAGALDMTASQLMTRQVETATPRTTVGEAMAMMTNGRFRHIPVMEGGALVGIVSIGDVVKARLDQQAQEVDSLRAYVSGG
jgi:CBS domain-containing protein